MAEELKPAKLPIKSSLDVIIARRLALNMATGMGFPEPEATKIAVVVSELARNIVLYTDGGTVTLTAQKSPGAESYFEIIAIDKGPGIADVARVLAGGYTTSKGLGKGVSGSKRLMDTFDIVSTLGKGTTIKAKKVLKGK